MKKHTYAYQNNDESGTVCCVISDCPSIARVRKLKILCAFCDVVRGLDADPDSRSIQMYVYIDRPRPYIFKYKNFQVCFTKYACVYHVYVYTLMFVKMCAYIYNLRVQRYMYM